MTGREQKTISLYFAFTGLIGFLNYAFYFFPLTTNFAGISKINLRNILFTGSPVIFLFFFGLAAYFWRNPVDDRGFKSHFSHLHGSIGGVLLLAGGMLIGLLTYGFMVYASFRITLLWVVFSLLAVMIWMVITSSAKDKFLYICILNFDLGVLTIYQAQKLLFPLESYWLPISCGFLAYIILEQILVGHSLVQNVFLALDQGSARIGDILLIFFGPASIALALSLFWQGSLVFLLPVMGLICILYAGLTSLGMHLIAYIAQCREENKPVIPKTWLISLAAVVFIYGAAFCSLKFYPTSNPLFEGGDTTKGIWFTIDVKKSELFPYGYARLEDSIFDDIGKPFIAAIGQTLGLVQKCKYPGPDASNIMPSPQPETMIQPRYVYSVYSMCIEWQYTLPGFFWRIGLVGLFLLSMIIGRVVFKDPLDFAIIAILLLGGWYIWPESEDIRMGDVAVLISGMAFVGAILPLLRRNRLTYLVLWGIISGFLFSLAGFVRSPSGMALFVASLLILAWAGIREKRIFPVLITSASLLVGYSIFNSALNGLFIYRDNKLQITAPSISPRGHGSGFALLGGLGGKFIDYPSSYEYKNSMDMGFKDSIVFFNLYNDNPMITFTQNSLENTLKTGERLFWRYVSRHPFEFIFIAVQKACSTFIEILKFPINRLWLSGFLLCAFLARLLSEQKMNYPRRKLNKDSFEVVIVLVVLCVVSTGPVVLTTPYFSEAIYPSSAVAVFTAIPAVYLGYRLILEHFRAKGRE